MLRIRLHGRGGQGIKTASQILGSAVFFSGFQVQDFPLYGAERRGAPIIAGVRVDKGFILERGPIERPDIILVGDETLLEDPLIAPLEGADESTAIFINSTHSPERLMERCRLAKLPIAFDLSQPGARFLKRGMLLSASLAAVGARLMGNVSMSCLLRAVRSELLEHGVSGEMIGKNLALAKEIFDRTPPGKSSISGNGHVCHPSPLIQMEQKEVKDAAVIILAVRNMGLRKTGNWRMERPVIDYEKCNDCWICVVRCPDGVIHARADARPEIDYDHCKGCLICAEECPLHAIDILKEAPSWT